MSEILKEWVSNIFIAVLLISFIEVILPSGNMRKYIKFILSIILLAIMLQPLLEYKQIKYSTFEDMYFIDDIEDTIENQELATIQNIQISSVYKLKLKNEISTIILDILHDSEIKDIKIKIYENVNRKNFGEIHSIYVDMTNINHDSSHKEQMIKAISEKLNLSKKKISINIQNNKAGG